jgi:hypothetical protein
MLAGTTFWLLPDRAAASTGAFITPVKLSAPSMTWAWFPSVAADDSGNVHVVFNSAPDLTTPPPDGFDIGQLWYTRTNNARDWSKLDDIAVVYSGDAQRNSIVADSAGRVHLIYKGWGKLEPPPDFDPPHGLGPEDVWYTATTGIDGSSIHAWSPPTQITTSTLGYYSDISIDSKGVLHVIWTESDAHSWGIYYTNSSDGGATWSDRVALDEGNYVWWYRAHLEIDANDGLHVVWEVTDPTHLGRTRATFYAQSTDGGKTWTRVLMGGTVPKDGVDDPDTGPQQPTIGIDGSGELLFVYRENETNVIYYRLSTDGTHWSSPQRLPGVAKGIYRPYDIYDMATDGAGHVHLAFVGYPDGSDKLGLMHSEWDGHAWLPPQVVVSAPPYPEYPKVAIGGGNRLHIVWFDGDVDSIDRTPIAVYYSSADLSAPHVASSALPVPMPTVTQRQTTAVEPLPSHLADRLTSAPPMTVSNEVAPSDRFNPLHTSAAPLIVAVAAVALLIIGVAVVSLGFVRLRRGT